MSARTDDAAQAAMGAGARKLHLCAVRDETARLAEIAVQERQTQLGFFGRTARGRSR